MDDHKHNWRLFWIAAALLTGTGAVLCGLGYLLSLALRGLLARGAPRGAVVCLGGIMALIPIGAVGLLQMLAERLDERPHVRRTLWVGGVAMIMAFMPLMMVWIVYLLLADPAP